MNRFSDSSDRVRRRQEADAPPRDNGPVKLLRGMPWGIALFLLYGLLVLTGVGLALGPVVERAILIPITFEGLVLMALLAYTIFTVTLVIQRKEAARPLAIGLLSLAVPAVPLAVLNGQLIIAGVIVAIVALLYRGLRAPAALAWLDQP